jgi:dihydroorotate dehydrogenase electron transfer subunit
LQTRDDNDKIRHVVIEDVIDASPTVRTFVFKDAYLSNAEAGQFMMVWIPRVDEIPMSVMIDPYDREGYAAVTVRRHGYATTALYEMSKGSTVGIRGPYGRGFSLRSGNVILVGGGTGLVPLLRLCKQLRSAYKDDVRIDLIMGSRSKEEVILTDVSERLVSSNGRVTVCTDDGSYGVRGYASDVFDTLLKEYADKSEDVSMVYTCGPERMMLKVLLTASKYGIDAQASLERIMKCGIGLCSSCCIGRYILCKDGPVMDMNDILALREFGSYARDKSGRLISI